MDEKLNAIHQEHLCFLQEWRWNDERIYRGFIFKETSIDRIRAQFMKDGFRFRTENQSSSNATFVCSSHNKPRDDRKRKRNDRTTEREYNGQPKQVRKTLTIRLNREQDCFHRICLIFVKDEQTWKSGIFISVRNY